MDKKPVIVLTVANKENFPFAVMMLNSLRKFHDWPVVLVTDEKSPDELKKLPENIEIKDLDPYIKTDPSFFYRQKPVLAEEYIKDYDLVLGLDSDQIICGDLSYILETKDYDVGTVVNWNRVDHQQFGYVQGWGILPPEYFNCGLVAMRSEKFVHHWKVICFSEQFNRMQYKEQDLLNILCYYGNYNIRCFDHGDKIAGMNAWWGLISKGEWLRAIMKENRIIIPKDENSKPFPVEDTEIKVLHFAGGVNNSEKMQFRTKFQESVIDRLDYLVSSK